MLTIIYRAIVLLIIVFTGLDLWKEDRASMKINATMVMVPLLLRLLMIK